MTRTAAIGGMFVALAAASCGKPGPPPPASSGITEFRVLFQENCSGCHGAEGRNGAAQELNNAEYLSIAPRDVIAQTIANGTPGTPMPAFARSQGGPLYPKQITALVDGIENNWAKPVKLSGTPPPYSAPEGDAAAGAQVFAAVCTLCHGPKGRVGPVTDQSYLALVSDQGLRTTIIVGRPSLGMPDWRHQPYHGGLSNEDIANVVAWLSSQRSPLTEARQQRESGANQFENGSGQTGEPTKGNEGSGSGPGSPSQQTNEGNRGSGTSSVQGGPGQSNNNTTPEKHQ
ncbi:MAG TPA: c-type cytochrome [Bryobacteraceae bacterium]|nr:c-type cytochrome [Bryobacteraceae bacterium]